MKGPILWDAFFEDVNVPIQKAGFKDVEFADDLNAYRSYDGSASNRTITKHAVKCQTEVHRWGRANQVVFEPTKESMTIISNHEPEGPEFKLMGVVFDPTLNMKRAANDLANAFRWKLTKLLRAKQYLDTPSAVIQFKSRILSYVEHRTAAIYHSDSTVLDPVDKQYDRFLSELGLIRKDALFSFSLAPLNSRRDMAMLGVIHRSVLKKEPEQIHEFYELEPNSTHPTGRSSLRRHDKQLKTYRRGKFLETTAKSILGLIDIYNMLPQELVDIENVRAFQSKLQAILKKYAATDAPNWETLFSPRHALHLHPLVKVLNAVVTINVTDECLEDMNGMPEQSNPGDAPIATRDLPPSWWGRMR